MSWAIKVENLGKKYRSGEVRGLNTNFREAFSHAIRRAFSLLYLRRILKLESNVRSDADNGHEFWALRDINLEIREGEVVGIIGRNGAGKSTLLKILSRITPPTCGIARYRGRLASLLEVGTGFHRELTGLENIYLNGSILGMRRDEVTAKLDEIVAFAELREFLDTPVKFYSSGMYVRLAFAVAAHLETDILLVDEVLAVGDTEFQKKCLGKMGEVAKQGRTVLFVSHSMGTINRLCGRSVWLDRGQIRLLGRTDEVVTQYLSHGSSGTASFPIADLSEAPSNQSFRLRAVRIKDHRGNLTSSLDVRRPFFVEIEYEVRKPITGLRVGFRLLTADGTVVFSSTDKDGEQSNRSRRSTGVFVSRCEIPAELLNKGQYMISIGIDVPMIEEILFLDNALSFSIEPVGGLVGAVPDNRLGVICPTLRWTVCTLENSDSDCLSRDNA